MDPVGDEAPEVRLARQFAVHSFGSFYIPQRAVRVLQALVLVLLVIVALSIATCVAIIWDPAPDEVAASAHVMPT